MGCLAVLCFWVGRIRAWVHGRWGRGELVEGDLVVRAARKGLGRAPGVAASAHISATEACGLHTASFFDSFVANDSTVSLLQSRGSLTRRTHASGAGSLWRVIEPWVDSSSTIHELNLVLKCYMQSRASIRARLRACAGEGDDVRSA